MGMSEESKLERQCRVLAELRNGRLLKWISPGVIGVPDRILLLPTAEPVFVEFKREGGKRTPRQISWGDWLEDNRFQYRLIERYHEFELLIEELVP